MIERIVRAALLAGVASLVSLTTLASYLGPAPHIENLSAWVVKPGDVIAVSGTDLTSALGGCTSLGVSPSVVFHGLMDNADHPAQLVGTDASNCSDTLLKVIVPAGFSGGALIYSLDDSSPPQKSNENLEITLQPTATLTPASGPVGTSVSINATNGSLLRPPTVVAGTQLHLSYPGVADPKLTSWGNQVGFRPGNTSGSAQLSFAVNIDIYNPSSQQTVTVGATNGSCSCSYTFLPPTVNTTPVTGKVVGDQLALSGANLGSGGSVTFAGGPVGQGQSWSSTQAVVVVPPGAQNGAVTVQVNGYGPSVSGPSISINPLVKTMTPASGSAGTAVALAGYNFGAAAGKVSAGGVDQTVSSWADQAVAFTLGGDTDTGAVTITRADGVVAAAPTLTIVPRLDKIETNNVKAGASIVVDGVSFGANPGTAKIGSAGAKSQLWSRTSTLLTVPASMTPGTYPVVLTSATGAASNALNLTVVPGAAVSSPSASSNAPVNPSQFIDNNHQFHKPPKTDSPVQLALTLAKHQLSAGGVCDLTVVLTLNGKPVNGAEVNLRMLYTPGSDYKFTPASGTTDANGTFTAKVQISKVNGDTIVEADSGIFSDQDHILGIGGAKPLATVNPANTGGIVPLAGLGVLAVLLVGLGVWLNLRSGRTARA